MTSMITGVRDWRREGIVHKNNEVRAVEQHDRGGCAHA